MRLILSEKSLVVVLFVMVLVTFSLAQEDSKKMVKMYSGVATESTARLLSDLPAHRDSKSNPAKMLPRPAEQ